MKMRPVGAEFFHADRRTDGRTDTTKLMVASLDFANAPKNSERAGTICHAVRSFLYFFPLFSSDFTD